MKNSLAKYLDIAYFVKLFLIFTVLYYFNIFYLGLTDPKNYYNSFLDHYLNYIDWFRTSILYGANLIVHLLGVNAYIAPPEEIKTPGGASVLLEFSCLGMGILSFWIAFVVANAGSWKRKLYWCLGGLFFIWFINCCRIGILLFALEKRWPETNYIDHHDIFNIVAYVIILTLIYVHSQEKTVLNYN